MKRRKRILRACLLLSIVSLLASCGKEVSAPPPTQPDSHDPEDRKYTGKEAIEVREKTVIELLAIKNDAQIALERHPKELSMESLISELEGLRPRLESIHRESARLPKKEQMVIYGNLAVTNNQLEKKLLSVLAMSPGNDELALQIASIREGLLPIPLGSVLKAF